MSGLSQTLTITAALGAGLSAGVYFAFSTFVMKALERLPASQGIAAMQALNKTAPNPLFMLALFGTAVVCIALVITGIGESDTTGNTYRLIATGIYMVSVVITVVYHVPHNNALALLDPNAPSSAAQWVTYVTNWTNWNHVRTITSLIATGLLVISLNK